MPTYQRFEDMPVWQTAAALYEACDDFLEHAPPRLRSSVRYQLERSALSVSNNIAEGFERGTTNELLNFLYIARGSSGEVRSILRILMRRPWMTNLKTEISDLIERAESCSRQLRAWAESLQNTNIRGHRHPNDESRERYQESKNAPPGLPTI
jgi:four helix bundle protein